MKIVCQFSLRSMILVMVLVAFAFAYEAHQESQRQSVVASILTLGGDVTYSPKQLPWVISTRRIETVTIPYLALDQVSDGQLQSLVNLREIVIPDVQFPCPGQLKKRKQSCLVPRVDLVPVSVRPDALETIAKLRGRQEMVSYRELKESAPVQRDSLR